MKGYIDGKGAYKGATVTARIVVGDDWYTIMLDDDIYKGDLQEILNGTIIEGGTYPLPEYTLLKAYYALDRFFGGKWQSHISGQIKEMPWAEGVVY